MYQRKILLRFLSEISQSQIHSCPTCWKWYFIKYLHIEDRRPKSKSHIYFDFHKFLPLLFECGYWQIDWFID